MAYSCEPLPILPLNLSCNLTPTGFLVLAGSSSSLSIMSGVSFEAVARIGGRYWSVPPFFRLVTSELSIDYLSVGVALLDDTRVHPRHRYS